MIKTWIIIASGFTQSQGRVNGTEVLWRRLRPEASPETCVLYRLWDDDAEGTADFIARNSHREGARIVVAAYSWGAGCFFRAFADRCAGLGLEIGTAVLCDPVYRSRFVAARWLAMVSFPKIRVADSVRRVVWLRQRLSRPAGHRPLAADAFLTHIEEPIELPGVRHSGADDSPLYHAAVMAAVQSEIETETETE